MSTHSRVTASVCLALAMWLGPVAARAQSDSASMLSAYWLNTYGAVDLQAQLAAAPASVTFERDATAQPDQCHYGVDASGSDVLYQRNIASFVYPGDYSKANIKSCAKTGGRLKTNQAYVWGLTEHNGVLWFGTIANTLCLVLNSLGTTTPGFETSAWACEMGNGRDNRPPRIFTYNVATRSLNEMTALVLGSGAIHQTRLLNTIGLRSAGSHNGVVLLGGIGTNGVNLFAFNGSTGQFLGSATPLDRNSQPYTNIRQFIVANDEMYVGLGVGINPIGGAGAFGSLSGEILRWTGDTTNPFQFELVTPLAADPAYLVQYNDRIAVSTWGEPGRLGGQVIYLSPAWGDDGILTATDGAWADIWRLSQYEVEPSALQFGGAIGVVGEYLVWGTMFIPAAGAQLYEQYYPDAPDDPVSVFLGTARPVMIFRASDPGGAAQQVRLLYGNEQLPKYDATAQAWTLVPNGLGQAPLLGPPGLGSFFNNYTWWMTTHNSNLYVGTMDYLYVAERLSEVTGQTNVLPKELVKAAKGLEGADLWTFVSGEDAYPLTLTGAGNIANYGIRTMISVGNDLYLGSANPMNLLMGSPKGGWELIKVVPRK